DPGVPLILGRPFLRTARALIDVHGEEMILRDGDERFKKDQEKDKIGSKPDKNRKRGKAEKSLKQLQ
nr:uncharacterized protein [Tanacetum cinerariifolium]